MTQPDKLMIKPTIELHSNIAEDIIIDGISYKDIMRENERLRSVINAAGHNWHQDAFEETLPDGLPQNNIDTGMTILEKIAADDQKFRDTINDAMDEGLEMNVIYTKT